MKLIKVVFIFIMIVLSNENLYCQANDFYVKLFGTLQNVDKRIVGESNYGRELLIRYNTETPPDPTMQIGLEIGKKIKLMKKISLNSGFNYSIERNNYIRGFKYHVLEPPNSQHLSIPKWLDVYVYHLLGNTTGLNYEISNRYRINLGLELITYFRFSSVYYEALATHETKTWSKKEFFSFELDPFIGYRYKFIEIDVFYRLFHYKKIDRAIFNNNNTGYGSVKNDFETYNLPKFGISLKYWLSLSKKEENKPFTNDK